MRLYFNPRSPRGGATGPSCLPYISIGTFQSTLPTRGSDSTACFLCIVHLIISIHAPHEGERRHLRDSLYKPLHFNPRSPRGGATGYGIRQRPAHTISIHAPHEGERQGGRMYRFYIVQISIHAPHEGERPPARPARNYGRNFNPRSPRGGATGLGKGFGATRRDFNPRSPRGGATAEKCICMQHFREFAEYYPLRHGDARCIAPQDCIIQAFFGAKKRCFYVRLCFALKNKGVRG